jgi:hypothetical protein
MKNIIIETPKQHEKMIYKQKFQCTRTWRKEMLIKKLQANWTNVGPKEGVNFF